MKIDFRLKEKSQVTSGLVMELVPGLPSDKHARSEAIYIDEDAFGFVEPCIVRCWPQYSKYGHWGVSKIPADTWKDIIGVLEQLHGSLVSARCADDVHGLGFIFNEIKVAFLSDFEGMKMQIESMLTNLIAWLRAKCATCSFISIIGI